MTKRKRKFYGPGTKPGRLTKHLDEVGFEKCKAGSFRFGTVERYRGTDLWKSKADANLDAAAARLADFQEGLSETYLDTPEDVHGGSIQFLGLRMENVTILNSRNAIHVANFFNDYVACLSFGGFSKDRFNAIRDAGNSDIVAYIEYDTLKLVRAIEKACVEQGLVAKSSSEPIIHESRIHYSEKSRVVEVFDGFSYADREAEWLRANFFKPPEFEHEDEYRLIIDTGQLTKLPPKTENLTFESELFVSAIVDARRLI
ncbi:hypothetical protein K3162_03705 [Qipengyuania xiapuensis]|uniref:Uncharacterized protein n=1 Tax=Qipengyuania xiapuensis TaxID=2867236 RepID=A0ABX8ZWM5_9SPHN|nr:hypothetical protein [Qipengyuania xiapuensis]QZD93151.1 hypothetical protein K3162_03705 [Qipengyuania xiapuensis]